MDDCQSEWIHAPHDHLPQNLSQTLSHVNPRSYPNIYTALKIMAILPFTRCTCEQSASSIHLLRPSLRITMSQGRLNGLAAVYGHKDIEVHIEEVVEKVARKNKHRLQLLPFMDTDKNIMPRRSTLYLRFIRTDLWLHDQQWKLQYSILNKESCYCLHKSKPVGT